MTDEKDIVQELKRIVRLLAIVATQGKKQKDQIASLSQAGFEPREIAGLLGTTSNAVRVALVKIRKRTAHGRRSSQKQAINDGQET